MEPVSRTVPARIWVLGSIAVLFSIASAFSFFASMAQGMAAGDWIGLPGREANIAFAQHQAAHWLRACLFCIIASAVIGTIALPFYPDASRVPRFIARFILASIFSVLFAALLGIVGFSLISALHQYH
jgi:hypothetical protein